MSSTQHDGQPDSGTYRTYAHPQGHTRRLCSGSAGHLRLGALSRVRTAALPALRSRASAVSAPQRCLGASPRRRPRRRPKTPAPLLTVAMQVHFKANDQWYDIQDLHVNGVHPQLISVSESYIQVYDSSAS